MRAALTTLAIAAGFALPSDAADLSISVLGGHPSNGQVLIGVFDSDAQFLKSAVSTGTARIDVIGQARLLFDLDPGTYAVAVTYDVNGNGAMDRKALGLPAEPFWFSNNARAIFGPPGFARAAFVLPAAGTDITITLDTAD